MGCCQGWGGRQTRTPSPSSVGKKEGHAPQLQDLGQDGIPLKGFTETLRSGAARGGGWASPSCACDLGSGCPHAGFSGNPARCCSAGPAARAGVRGGGAQRANS